MNLVYSLLVLIGIGLIIGAFYYFFYITKDTEAKRKLGYFKFLFRWWLIGRYHCNVSPTALKFYQTLNKLFWGVVLIGLCLVVAKLVEALQWIL